MLNNQNMQRFDSINNIFNLYILKLAQKFVRSTIALDYWSTKPEQTNI